MATSVGPSSITSVVALRLAAPTCRPGRGASASRSAAASASATRARGPALGLSARAYAPATRACSGTNGSSSPTRDSARTPVDALDAAPSVPCVPAASGGTTSDACGPGTGPAAPTEAWCTSSTATGRMASSSSQGCRGGASPSDLVLRRVSSRKGSHVGDIADNAARLKEDKDLLTPICISRSMGTDRLESVYP